MYGGYNTDGAGVVLLILYLVVSFLFFLLIRALVLWYFRINEIVNELKKVTALLSRMLPDNASAMKDSAAPPFRWREDKLETARDSSAVREGNLINEWAQSNRDRL